MLHLIHSKRVGQRLRAYGTRQPTPQSPTPQSPTPQSPYLPPQAEGATGAEGVERWRAYQRASATLGHEAYLRERDANDRRFSGMRG